MLQSYSTLATALTLLCSITLPSAHAYPSNHISKADDETSLGLRDTKQPEWLRIMPLGASIVRGLHSTPEDGFRKNLRDNLRSQGFKVNMVGSQ